MGICLLCWHPLSWVETILTLTITLTIESLGELPRLWKHEAQCDCKCLFLWHLQLCNKNNPENCQATWPFNIGIGLIQYRLTTRKQERGPFLKNLSPNWRLGLQSWGCDSLVIITTVSAGMSLSSLNKMICLNSTWRVSQVLLYSTGKSTQCYVAAWVEGSSGENGHMYVYGWVPSLFTWNYHNIVC